MKNKECHITTTIVPNAQFDDPQKDAISLNRLLVIITNVNVIKPIGFF